MDPHQSRNPDQDQEQSQNEEFLPLMWHTAVGLGMVSKASFLNIYFSIKPSVTVADQNRNFSIPEPGSKRHRTPDLDPHQNFSIFNAGIE